MVWAAGRLTVSLLGIRAMVAETLAITSATMLIADSIRIFLSGVMFGLGVLRPIVNVFPDMLGIGGILSLKALFPGTEVAKEN